MASPIMPATTQDHPSLLARHGLPWVMAAGFFTYLALTIYGAIGFVPYENLFLQALGLAVCTAAAWIMHREACARASLVAFLICLICVWPTLQHTWPVPSVAVCAAMFFFWRPAWIMSHPIHRKDFMLALGCVAVCGVALVGWMLIFKPDVTGLAIMFPPWRWYALIPMLIVFSAANAFAEEFLFRGLFYDALKVVSPTWLVILAQGAAFGLLHFRVFPFGWLGVLMGTLFGIMMGFLRHRSHGIWLPWLAHALTDVGIGLLVLVNV